MTDRARPLDQPSIKGAVRPDRRARVGLSLLLVASLALVGGGALEIVTSTRSAVDSIGRSNLAVAEAMATLIASLQGTYDPLEMASVLGEMWDDVGAAEGEVEAFCVLDAAGVVTAGGGGGIEIGDSVGAMAIRGAEGERPIGAVLEAGEAYGGRASTPAGRGQIVGLANVPGGGGVLVQTSRSRATAAAVRAALPWVALSAVAALALAPLSALLLHNAYRVERRRAARLGAELDALFTSDAFGVAILDRELRYLRANRRLAQIDNRSVETMLGRTIYEAAAHVAPKIAPIILGVFESGVARTDVIVRLTPPGDPQGAERVYSAHYLPLRDASGEVEAVAVVVADLTALERAEGARRATERIYRTIVETAREGVWMLDGEDRTTFVNGRMLEILGAPESEVMGRPAQDAFPPEIREQVVRSLQRRHAGVSEEFTLRFTRRDGREVIARFSAAPLFDEGGRYAGAVTLVTDLTDSEERERLLLLSEDRFQAVVGAQGEFVARWRPDGTLLFVNDAYCEYFGRSRDELVGASLYTLIPEGDRQIVREKVRRMRPEQPSQSSEHRVVRADGAIGWQHWSDRGVFASDGALVELVSVGRDITPLRRAEERLRERERSLVRDQQHTAIGSWRWIVGEDRLRWSDGQRRLYGIEGEGHEPTLDDWLAMVCEEDRDQCRAVVGRALSQRTPSVFEFDIIRPDGARRTIQSALEVVVDGAGRPLELIGTSIDLTERRLAGQRQDVRAQALEKIAAGAHLTETLEAIAVAVERLTPGARCMVTAADKHGRLEVLSAPNLPQAYIDGVNGLEARAGLASCPACVAEARRVIVPDTMTDPNWAPVRGLAREMRIGACWSEPISDAAGRVIGSFSMSFGEARAPSEEDLETLRTSAQLAGIAISRLRDETALAESEERFRSLAASIDAVFWFAEAPPLEVHYVSPGFERVWGRKPAEIYAQPWVWNDAIHEDDRQRVRDVFSAWIEGRRPEGYSQEYRIVRPDGAIRWIRDHGTRLPTVRSGRRRIAGLAEDITERKEAELLLERLNGELREQRNTLETILGASSDLVFMYDADGGFSYLNRAAERLLGMPLESVRGKRVEELGQPIELYADFIEQRTRVLRDGVAERGQTRYPQGGEVREFDYVINPVFDAKGRVSGAVCAARDVTEQRRDAERLRLALQQLNFHVDNTPLAIVEWDAAHRVRRWSSRAEALFGWNAEEAVGKEWSNYLIHPDDRGKANEAAQRLIGRLEERNTVVNRSLTKDGRVVHCEWYNSVLFDDAGGLVSVLSLAQDITDRVRAEEALRESEERLRLALEASTDGIWEWSVPTGRIDWSDRVFAIFGRDRSLGAPDFNEIQTLAHPEDRERWALALTAHLERGAPFDIEYRILRPGGETAWVRAVGQAVRDASGNPVRVVGSVSDITERREAAENLRRAKEHLEQRVAERTSELLEAHDAIALSEARFRSIFENSGVGVLLADQDGMLVQANPAFERMLRPDGAPGAPNGRSAERSAWRLVLEACPALLEVCRGGRAALQDEVQVRAGASTALWLRVTAQSLAGATSAGDAAVVIVEDISQRRLAEDIAKKRHEELAHAARLITVGELAAGLAHELNQPLAAIAAYADGCARRLALERVDPETMSLLDKISGQARRAGSIIHRLKDLVRKQAPRREHCRLDVLLQETLELVAPTANARGAAITMRVPADLPLVEADWVQIQQVFLNLLTNALDAVGEQAPHSRRVHIEASHREGASAVTVAVQDTGPGLNGVGPEQIFESFYSTKAKGMGLGLPISRSIAEAHGGRLWCEVDGPGHGARFMLMIPCVRGEVAANG